MTRTRKHVRTWVIVPLLLSGALLAGCSDDGSSSGKDSGKDSGSASSGEDAGGGTTPTDPRDRALAYAQCMRENGVPKFPDPSDGGALKITPETGVDPGSPEFAEAQEACQDLSPQAQSQNSGPLDSAKVAEWAQCIRDHGVPAFPDPQINGGAMEIDLGKAGIGRDDSAFQEAMQACQSAWPRGGVMIRGGGPK